MTAVAATCGIAALATGGVIMRPWRVPEAVWAVAGAVALVVSGLLPLQDAGRGIARGTDVYLFLTGMMLLAEVARRERLFDWLAGHAARAAGGSAARLFTLIYAVGTLVTIFLSNDATAVVLTPAVAAVGRAAGSKQPLPYLLICAFVANAASFVLPISNPANLVIYGSNMPPLADWVGQYALPSAASIVATYGLMRVMLRASLRQTIAGAVKIPQLPAGGRAACAGILLTAASLMTASSMGWQIGLPTCAAGLLTTLVVLAISRESPLALLRSISWGVLPLVAGLFVLVEAVERTGAMRAIGGLLADGMHRSTAEAAWMSGVVLGFGCNVLNNLPAGLIAGTVLQAVPAPPAVRGALLIGVDLGPNLSVTGSLATILWLGVLRREGVEVRAGDFLRIGILVMPPALLLALAALVWR